MSLYESLEQVAAAGIIACAPALGIAVDRAAAAGVAARLPETLRRRGEAEGFGALLDALARDIWLGQEIRGVPHTTVEAHAVALAPPLSRCNLDPRAVGTALAASGRPATSRPGAEPWRAVAAEAAHGLAAAAPSSTASDLRADVVGHLVDDLMRHLLSDPKVLPAMRDAIAAAVNEAVGGEPDTSPAATAVPKLTPTAAAPAAPPPSDIQPGTGPAAQPDATGPRARPRATAVARAKALLAPDRAGAVALTRLAAPRRPLRSISARARAIAADRTGEAGTVAAISHDHELSEPALGRFLGILDRRKIPAGDRMVQLHDMARWLKATRALLLRAADEPAEIRGLKQDAAAALDDGEFETAAALLVEVRSHIRAERRDSEQRLRLEIEAIRRQSRAEAHATVDMAQMALTGLDFAAAAALFADAAETLSTDESAERFTYAMRAAEAQDRAADIDVAPTPFLRAVDRWQQLVRHAEQVTEDRDTCLAAATLGRAEARERLGRALTDAEALRVAASDYRQVQSLLPRTGDPIVARQIDLRLGRTLLALATMAPEQVAPDTAAHGSMVLDRASLDEAVLRLDRAAGELSRNDAPEDWASAQALLGESLLAAAIAAPDADRAGLLEQALAALSAATEVVTRERAPAEWARVQTQIATANRRLAAYADARRHWVAAASALVPALEVLDALGDDTAASEVRRALVDLREQFDAVQTAATS